MTFGERLKKARIASGINQADAAKKIGDVQANLIGNRGW